MMAGRVKNRFVGESSRSYMLKRGILAVNGFGPLSLAVNDSLDISVGEKD
jgi:hypothetical protein